MAALLSLAKTGLTGTVRVLAWFGVLMVCGLFAAEDGLFVVAFGCFVSSFI